jgi:hypothetical protein
MSESHPNEEPASKGRRNLLAQLAPWAITAGCFFYLYTKLAGAAARDGLGLGAYLGGIFTDVSWGAWLALMIPYSFFFFLIDSLIVWRVINWFNTKVAYSDILPIRGSSYILSILNEQVGKGAMGLYLNRRHGVPGWEVGSSMIFIMFCEFYYLLAWATIGTFISGERLPEVFGWIPVIAAIALAFLVLWQLFFQGSIAKGSALRDRPLFKSFREASLAQYGLVILMRSPALLVAVFVYKAALGLFGVEVELGTMLGYLPVIFFGAATPGPMR